MSYHKSQLSSCIYDSSEQQVGVKVVEYENILLVFNYDKKKEKNMEVYMLVVCRCLQPSGSAHNLDVLND